MQNIVKKGKCLVKFLREKDDTVYRLASMQARIFERSGSEGIASYFFIQQFMNSVDARSLDTLTFLLSGSSEAEIYFNVVKGIRRTKGKIYSPDILHWIGFFYRYASYLSNVESKKIFNKVKPEYLAKVYPLYHGLDIQKAVDIILDEFKIEFLTPWERFLKMYKEGRIYYKDGDIHIQHRPQF